MRIVVFGTGAIGGSIGGYLARSGADVTFIARGTHLRAIQEKGLEVETPTGAFVVRPVKATDDPSQVGVTDAILVCVKAWQLQETIKALKPMVGPKTFVVPLQNSIEAPDFLASCIGREHVLGGVCYTIARLTGPGAVYGDGGIIVFGELDNASTERVKSFRDLINTADGIAAEIPPDIGVRMWTKFIWISSAGLVGAVTHAPAGVWRRLSETRNLFSQILREAFAVAVARKIALTDADLQGIETFLDSRPDGFTTSMQRDILAGNRSELEYQAGAVVRLGEESGVATPLSVALHGSLLPQELRARRVLDFKTC